MILAAPIEFKADSPDRDCEPGCLLSLVRVTSLGERQILSKDGPPREPKLLPLRQ